LSPGYGIAALVLLVIALIWVRRIARRQRIVMKMSHAARAQGSRKISQRSDMRAGEATTTVMDQMQRTQSGRLKVRSHRR